MEALEKKLGINPDGEGSSEPLAGKKHRLDDTEYVEQSQEIVDNVKSAVTAGKPHRLHLSETLTDRASPSIAQEEEESQEIAAVDREDRYRGNWGHYHSRKD